MPAADQLLMLPLWYIVFLLSITCHEAAHAFVAYRGGDETAYLGGQVSLNPVPHMQREVFGTVIVPLLSFVLLGGQWMIGWASAPYDPYWEDRHPRRAALMAAAGPAANLVLAAIGFAILKVGLLQGVWMHADDRWGFDRLVVAATDSAASWDGLGRFASVMLTLNLVLFVFNLLPLPPMDGSAILAGLFEPARRLRDMLRTNSLSALVGLVIAWKIFPYLFGPIYWPVLSWLYY